MTSPIQRWLRVRKWFRLGTYNDMFFALAERSRSGLRQLLGRHVDLDAFRPRKAKRRSYLPELLVLETRMVPSITVSAFGSAGGSAGRPMDLVPIASFTDSN